jgi:hypothetical protein
MAAADETPPAVVATPAEIPGAEETPAAEETPPPIGAAPVETPAADETPAEPEAASVETPAANETPVATAAAPVETPAAEETPPAMQAAPVETPVAAPPGIADTEREQQPTGAGVSEGQPPAKETAEGAGVEEEAEAYAADRQAAIEDEGGGLSRGEAVRWLEIGLGAGVGILVVVWAFARFQRNMGNRP